MLNRKQNSAVRKYIAQRAELLGAVRLPNNAFKSNAGTEVTTDILFFQKRDRVTDIEPSWVHLGEIDGIDNNAPNIDGIDEVDGADGKIVTKPAVPISVNSYFAEHPEMIMGQMALDSRMRGNGTETACLPIDGADLSEQLAEAITNIHAEIDVNDYELDEDELEDYLSNSS